jgi:hypothetical protein
VILSYLIPILIRLMLAHVSHAYHILLMQPVFFAARLMSAVSFMDE